jgi:hypothetical protein
MQEASRRKSKIIAHWIPPCELCGGENIVRKTLRVLNDTATWRRLVCQDCTHAEKIVTPDTEAVMPIRQLSPSLTPADKFDAPR